MKALKDALYLIGLWFIGRCSPLAQADLMEKWARVLKRGMHPPPMPDWAEHKFNTAALDREEQERRMREPTREATIDAEPTGDSVPLKMAMHPRNTILGASLALEGALPELTKEQINRGSVILAQEFERWGDWVRLSEPPPKEG